MNLLTDGLKKIGISESIIEPIAEKMEQYINEIVLFNSAYNLTNTSEHDELVTRHILDSLAAYNSIKEFIKNAGSENFVLGDIGSGGGLPGIPLAAVLCMEMLDVKVILVERMEKRCAFLENCAAILGLKNVDVLNSEAERLEEKHFDLITFRAFRPLDKKMTKTLLRIVKDKGVLCAYKAKKENIIEEMNGIKELVPFYEVISLNVPGLEDSERNLVVIKR